MLDTYFGENEWRNELTNLNLLREAQLDRLRILLGNIFRDDKMVTKPWSLSHLRGVRGSPRRWSLSEQNGRSCCPLHILFALDNRGLPHARPSDPSPKLSLSCPLGDCGWLSYETYSVLNRKAQTSTMPSTEKMRSMIPVTIVVTTENQSSVYEHFSLSPRLQKSIGFSS